MLSYENAGTQPFFEAAARRQLGLVVGLTLVFALYYFFLVLGAAYFGHIFAIRVFGRVNIGLLFAISQYVFAGLVAWFYVSRMHGIDASLGAHGKAREVAA
jgi:uncharacterized membrane protein (DUF485 family)